MRRHATGSYDDAGHFVLADHSGGQYLTVSPNEIFSVGNSIGGYWAKPIRYAGQSMLALVRLTGTQKTWPLAQIRAALGRERGEVLRPGPGLWAVSSGAARRGVWHQHRPSDPLTEAVRAAGFPASIIHEVPSLATATIYEGGNLCSHSTHGGSYYGWLSDCVAPDDWRRTNVVTVREATYVERHSNQYHIGCQASASVLRLEAGTWCIQYAHRSHDGWTGSRDLVAIYLAPEADRAQVAAGVADVLGVRP